MKRIYVQTLKNNKVLAIENLNWAFPSETYKIYVCSELANHLEWHSIDVWAPPDDVMNYIEEVYLLEPGQITRLQGR